MDGRNFFLSFFLIILLLSPSLSSSTEHNIDNGYDIIHTRVIEDGLTLVEPEALEENSNPVNFTKYRFTYGIWNPTSSPMIFNQTSFEGILKIGMNFTLDFTDLKPVVNQQNNNPSDYQIIIQPGLNTFSIEDQEYIYDEDILYDGMNNISIIPNNSISWPLVSLNSTVLLENSTSTEFYPPDFPSSWGDQDPQYDNLMIAVTNLDLHQYIHTNSGIFYLNLQGEYWNPTDRPVYTGSSGICGEYEIEGIFPIYDERYFVNPSGCYDRPTSYTSEPGAHQWSQGSVEFYIMNLNDTTLPDGVYTFYFHLYQNPDNIHYAYLTAENGTYTYSFDDYPDDWGSNINSNNSNSLLDVNYIFSILFVIFILSYRTLKPKNS